MSSSHRSAKSVTAPKGRPTPQRPRSVEQANRRATLGWIAVALAVAGILVVAVYLTRDAEPNLVHSGSLLISLLG